jgi:hypothetical protein
METATADRIRILSGRASNWVDRYPEPNSLRHLWLAVTDPVSLHSTLPPGPQRIGPQPERVAVGTHVLTAQQESPRAGRDRRT